MTVLLFCNGQIRTELFPITQQHQGLMIMQKILNTQSMMMEVLNHLRPLNSAGAKAWVIKSIIKKKGIFMKTKQLPE